MAKQVSTHYVDDLDGGDALRTVAFSWNDTNYEIDLSQGHIDAVNSALAPFIAAARRPARRAGGRAGRRPAKALAPPSKAARRSGSGQDATSIRDWARSAGLTVSDRGRISGAIIDAFHAAQGTGPDLAPGGGSAADAGPATRSAGRRPRSGGTGPSRRTKRPSGQTPPAEAEHVNPTAEESSPVGKAVAKQGSTRRRAVKKATPTTAAADVPPVKSAAAKRAPAKRAPAKRAPAKRAPAKRAPAKQASVRRTVVAEPSVVPDAVALDALALDVGASDVGVSDAVAMDAVAMDAVAMDAVAQDAGPDDAVADGASDEAITAPAPIKRRGRPPGRRNARVPAELASTAAPAEPVPAAVDSEDV